MKKRLVNYKIYFISVITILVTSIVVSLFDSDDCSLKDLFYEKGFEIIELHIPMKKALVGGLTILQRVIENNGCNIVHSNGLKSDVMCFLLSKRIGINHVITLHNYLKEDVYLRKNRIYSFCAIITQRFVLKRSCNIIACSKTLMKQMLDDIPGLRIKAIQNGVDTKVFYPQNMSKLREEYGVSQDAIIVISTGRMTPRKRILETGTAFLNATLGANYLLWFVGEGDHFEEYRSHFEKNKNIKFWGKRTDISNLLNMANYFVSSSETEGLPLAVLEAISSGKKVILSDIPQHEEILDELQDVGYTYPLGNIEELTELFKNKLIHYHMDDISPLRGTDFDVEMMGERYSKYYEEVLSKAVK